MLRKFKANVHMSRETDEVVPAQWRDEGDKTLVPSAEMVGKVDEALKD